MFKILLQSGNNPIKIVQQYKNRKIMKLLYYCKLKLGKLISISEINIKSNNLISISNPAFTTAALVC